MPSATEGVGARGGVGARLRSARERSGLSLIQAAEKLHIDPATLEALEADRFDQLGAPVYVRGYIRHYASLVGEPEAPLQESYAASGYAARTPDLTRFPRVETATPSGPLLFPGVVVVIAVAIIGMAWWISGNLNGSKTQRGGIVSAVRPAGGGGPAVGVPVAGQGRATGAAPAPTTQGAVVAGTRPSSAGSSGAVGPSQIPAGPLQTPATPSQTATGPSQAAAGPSQAAAGPHLKLSALTMRFSEDSWTEVYDARGERLFYDVGFAGSTRTVRGVPPLRIVLGNPPEVALQLDGRSVAVPGVPRNVMTEFRVARSGRVAPMRLAAAERGGSEDRRRAGSQETH